MKRRTSIRRSWRQVSDSSRFEGFVSIKHIWFPTGYGKFNVLLFLAALPVAWAGIFDTTTTAFMIASAECDLRLTYFRKGVLAAIPFLGTISFPRGPLQVAPRRSIIRSKRFFTWRFAYLCTCSIVILHIDGRGIDVLRLHAVEKCEVGCIDGGTEGRRFKTTSI